MIETFWKGIPLPPLDERYSLLVESALVLHPLPVAGDTLDLLAIEIGHFIECQ